MKLVIGGYAQGKLDFVLKKEERKGCRAEACPDEEKDARAAVWDGELPDEVQLREAVSQEKRIVVNHFHEWVKTCLHRGEDPEEKIKDFLKQSPDSIIISDEIGNGIVPIDEFEREYRERTGRLLVMLAGHADEVVRVICGIGQKIK